VTTNYHPAISGSLAYIPEERRRRRWIWTPSRPSNVARRLDKDDDGGGGGAAGAATAVVRRSPREISTENLSLPGGGE